MKNLSLVLNVVLAVAVAILYYFHFSDNKKTTPPLASIDGKASTEQIVYVNTDSLMENYDYAKKVRKDLDTKQEAMENELQSSAAKLQAEFTDAQNRVNSMTAREAESIQESLGKKQQELMSRKEELNDVFSTQLQKMNEDLVNRIHAYLIAYNKDKNYHFILGYAKAGGILYANDGLEITKDILKGMNEEYAKEKK